MEDNKNKDIIDLRVVVRKILDRKKLFLIVWLITFVLACAWILPQPRYYDTEVVLAPETGTQVSGGALSSLASSFGINLGSVNNADALYPLLYPDIVSSNDFIVGLFGVPVESVDGEIATDYLTYLVKYQKHSFWDYPKMWVRRLIDSIFPPKGNQTIGAATQVDPFRLSKKEEKLVEGVKNLITCSVDKKTDVITLHVADQDPLICATLADSVRARLQDFIISYRTSKARIDMDYYDRLTSEAHVAYQEAMEVYSRFCDNHRNIILQSVQSERDELENAVQLKFNTYNVMNTQLEAAKARVQERTPAFTILQNATVPNKPSRPKRMVFVAAMLFLSTFITLGYIVVRDIQQMIPPLS